MMGSELAPTGSAGVEQIVLGEIVEDPVAAMGLVYPIRGVVIESASTRLHRFQPTLTIRADEHGVTRSAEPNHQGSFERCVLTIAGGRYWFWVPIDDVERPPDWPEAVNVLIYAQPSDVRRVKEK